MKIDVAVTGLGVISPIGNSVDEFWNNCIRGVSGVGPISHFDASRVESKIAAEVKNFDPSRWIEKKRLERWLSSLNTPLQHRRRPGTMRGFLNTWTHSSSRQTSI